jgi:uncharacterized protein
MLTAEAIIRRYALEPHPEGGHYREIFRSATRVEGVRSASTAIYFLLQHGEFSAFHRVKSDEVWHHYLGDAIELHSIDAGAYERHEVGSVLGDREHVHVVKGGVWQAARVVDGSYGFALCGCTVAPGFEFADFELPSRRELAELFPELAAIIAALTR